MKRFNTTGICISKKHFMVNIDNKLKKIIKLIEEDSYFTINRPRQYGKTTTLNELKLALKEKYLIVSLSFEGLGDSIFKEEESFSKKFLELMERSLEFQDFTEATRLKDLSVNINNLDDVSKAITKFVKESLKEVILIIDEVDKSSNNQLFLSFLGMLRNKYLSREISEDFTFKSVILAGVYDIKSLKLKINPSEETKYNSPWNIAVDFNVDMSFSIGEIETMLKEYEKAYEISMNTRLLSERLYFFTSGYPFLVSRLCKIIDESIYEDYKKPWKIEDIDKAVKLVLNEKNTLFDSLIKNLENNDELYKYIKDFTVLGIDKTFNIDNPLVNIGVTYGYFTNFDGKVSLSNRVFKERIFNYMVSKLENASLDMSKYNFKNNFITNENGLNINKICEKFQQYMKENYSSVDEAFIEREGRLIFMAFIAPIINGVGFAFKEIQISEEKRLDIVIAYNSFKYIIELKIWRGHDYHEKGLKQLSDYLDIQGLSEGALVTFNFNKKKEYLRESIIIENKKIFLVMV